MKSSQFAAVLFCLMLSAGSAFSTEVCGEIFGVWDVANSPYLIMCDVTLPVGQTLEIGPGVRVEFMGPYRFEVNGNLQAIGTDTDSIYFTTDTLTNPIRWRGLRFTDPSSSQSRLTYCLIEFSYADTVNSPEGGGIYCDSASPSFSYLTIANCFGGTGGGAFFRDYSSPYVINCIFKGNSASGSGGGLSCVYNSAPTLIGCVFTGNLANAGGALFTRNEALLTVTNCTFVANYASSVGGGLYNRSGHTTTVVVNSVFWGNSAPADPEIHIQNGGVDVTYTDIQGNYPGSGNADLDPMFVDLSDGDFHLRVGSPCIDTGSPNSPLDPDSSIADMGAYPFNHSAMCGRVTAGGLILVQRIVSFVTCL